MNQRGYTLAELVLAMAIFSFVAVAMATGLIKLYKIYQSGVEIRATQQSARLLAEKISRDVRDRQLIAVGAQPGVAAALAPNHSAVCMLNVDAKNPSAETYTGVKYYSVSSNGNYKYPDASVTNTDSIKLYRANVTITTVPGGLSAACTLAVPNNPELISADDVSIVAFSGTAIGSQTAGNGMFSLKMSVAAKDGQTDISAVSAAAGGTCADGAQYCSITNLLVAAGPGGGNAN